MKDWFAPVSINNFRGGLRIWMYGSCFLCCKFNSILGHLKFELTKNFRLFVRQENSAH